MDFKLFGYGFGFVTQDGFGLKIFYGFGFMFIDGFKSKSKNPNPHSSTVK